MRPPEIDFIFLFYTSRNMYFNRYPFFNANLLGKYRYFYISICLRLASKCYRYCYVSVCLQVNVTVIFIFHFSCDRRVNITGIFYVSVCLQLFLHSYFLCFNFPTWISTLIYSNLPSNKSLIQYSSFNGTELKLPKLKT